MATTLDLKLCDDIMAQAALEEFVDVLAPLTSFSTNFSEDAQKRGDQITIPLIKNMTASNTENDYETDTGNMAAVEINLNKYSKVTVGHTDKEFMNSSVTDLEKWAKQQGAAVAADVVQGVFNLITPENFPTIITPSEGMSMIDLVRQSRLVLNGNKVPLSMRSLFPKADAFHELTGDKNLQLASAMVYGGTEIIREGTIPRLLGFDVHESTIEIPGENNGFAVFPSALAVALRPLIPSEPAAYLEHRVITDDKTGISLSYRRHYAPGKGKQYVTFECIWGATIGVKEGLVILPEIPAS